MDLNMMLSEHLSLREMLRSSTGTRLGLQNTPEPHHLDAMKRLAAQVEKVRALLGNRPLSVNSGYRSRALNTAIKGSKRSQHCRGEAIDFEVNGVDNLAACKAIAASDIGFDQIIMEYYTPGDPQSGWVHFSYCQTNRRQVLTAFLRNGATIYKSGLPDGIVI
jgi:hypothetical protein